MVHISSLCRVVAAMVIAALLGTWVVVASPGPARAEEAPPLSLGVTQVARSTVTISVFRAGGMTALTYWFDDDAPQTSSSWDFEADVSGLSEGQHVLHGIVEDDEATASFVIDRTAPVLSVTPKDGDTDNSVFYAQVRPPVWTVDSADATDVTVSCGVLNAQGQRDGGVCSGGSFAPSFYGYGAYTLDVTATDAAGNQASIQLPFTYTLHPDAPTIAGPAVIAADAEYSFTSPRAGATFECRLDTALTWSPCTSPVAVHETTSAGHWLSVRVLGSEDSPTVSNTLSFTADLTAPYYLITRWKETTVGPAGGPLKFNFIQVEAHPTDAVPECSLALDGATPSWSPCASLFSYVATPTTGSGVYYFRVKTTDVVGNEGVSAFKFTYDGTPPSVAIAAPTRPALHQRDFVVSADLTAKAERCRVDAGPWVDCATRFRATGLRDGRHTLELSAEDALGNVGRAVRTFDVDDTSPVVTFVGNPSRTQHLHGKKRMQVTIGVSAGEASRFVCQLNGGAAYPCTSGFARTARFTVRVAKGTHHIRVYAIDGAGNRSKTIRAGWFVKR